MLHEKCFLRGNRVFLLGKQSVSIGETLCVSSPRAMKRVCWSGVENRLKRVKNGLITARKRVKCAGRVMLGDVR